jgi:hypothetical protein
MGLLLEKIPYIAIPMAGLTLSGQEVLEGSIWHDAAWSDDNHVTLIGTPELIFELTDATATWPINNLDTSTLNEALYDVVFTENGTGYIIGSEGVLFKKLPKKNTFSIMSMYNIANQEWSMLGSFELSVDGSLSSGYNISDDGSNAAGNSWKQPLAV